MGAYQNLIEMPDRNQKEFEFVSCCVFLQQWLRRVDFVCIWNNNNGKLSPDMEIIIFDAMDHVNICGSNHIFGLSIIVFADSIENKWIHPKNYS